MNLEKIRKFIYRNKFHKKLFILIILSIVFLYLKTFFTIGVIYDEIFLKRKIVSNERHYIGSNEYGTIDIRVKLSGEDSNTKSVIFNFPNNSPKKYTIKYNRNNLVENIRNDNDKIIFQKSNERVAGIMGQGATFLANDTNIRIKKTDDKSDYYNISIIDIVRFSKVSYEGIRGDAGLLILAIFLSTVYIIDLAYPLFFFNMKYFLSVRNPEPTDFYIKTQKISWFIYPLIIFIMLLKSIKLQIL